MCCRLASTESPETQALTAATALTAVGDSQLPAASPAQTASLETSTSGVADLIKEQIALHAALAMDATKLTYIVCGQMPVAVTKYVAGRAASAAYNRLFKRSSNAC